MQKIFMRTTNDCYTCCLATLLGLPYEDAPRTYDKNGNCYADWEERITTFLYFRGLQVIRCHVTLETIKLIKGAVIVGGLSYTPRFADEGLMHAVIYKDGELWHDPKRDPEGVIVPTEIDIIFPIF